MTYSDLEQRTLFALRNEETARAVREKYDYVFVDEYQDTSDVQEALVSKIAQNGNLFMVGDVKQSIYRFRQAEPRLFLEKYYAYGRGEGGKRLALTQNFRSKDTVIDFVNLIFERLMTGGDAEIEYDALARLNAGSADATGGEPVEIHLVDSAQKAQLQENAEEEEQRKWRRRNGRRADRAAHTGDDGGRSHPAVSGFCHSDAQRTRGFYPNVARFAGGRDSGLRGRFRGIL